MFTANRLSPLVFFGLFLWSAFLPSRAAASPWVPEPLHGFLKLGYAYSESASFFTIDADTRSVPRFTSHELTFFGDIGIAPRVALSLTGNVAAREQAGEVGGFAFGNLIAMARVRITSSPAISVALRGSIPLVDGRERPLHTDRVFSLGPRVSIGHGFSLFGLSAFASFALDWTIPVTFGPTLNEGRIATSVNLIGEAGAWLHEYLMVKVRAQLLIGVGHRDALDRERFIAQTPERQDSFDLGIGALIPVERSRRVGIDLYLQRTLWGRSRALGTLVSAGVYTTF